MLRLQKLLFMLMVIGFMACENEGLVPTDNTDGINLRSAEISDDLFGQGECVDCEATNTVAHWGDPQEAVYLFKSTLSQSGEKEGFIIEPEPGSVSICEDGTAHISFTVIEWFLGTGTSNPNNSWTFDVWLTGGYTWDEWSAMGRTYVNFTGNEGAHLDWLYYIVDPEKESWLIGNGDNVGNVYPISHMPADYSKGIQLGTNGRNQDFGLWGWWSIPSDDGTYVRQGDFLFDLSCEVRPPDDDCGDCDGKVSELTLQYNGSEVDAEIEVVQKKDGLVAFSGTVQPGEDFSFIGQDKHGTLSPEITIYVNGEEHTKMHTSCSQPIGPGVIAGDFEVIAGESRNGGTLCPAPNPDPDPDPNPVCCEGKVTELALQYNGSIDDAEVEVIQKKDGQVAFFGTVQPGDEFSFSGLDKHGTLSTEIIISVNGEVNTQIHTSCSVDIGPGYVSGDFEVIEGESRNGGALCPVN